MWRLVLNAAEARLDILLGDAQGIRAVRRCDTPTRATEALAPALREMFVDAGIKAHDLDAVACVAGPGSFTGIRLTLSTAAALRRVVPHLRLAGLNFLEAVAAMGLRLHSFAALPPPPQVWALTHARRNSVHLQGFIVGAGARLTPASDLALMDVNTALAHLRTVPDTTLLVGTGLAHNPQFAADLPHCRLLPDGPSQPEDADLWALACATPHAEADITPLYVRPCDAVDNLSHIAANQGQDPDAAHNALRSLLTAPVRDTSHD